jgi:hypothetical protein
MRILAIAAAAAALSVSSAAMAAPAQVQVDIGPKLQAKAEKTYGVREVRDLADELQRNIEQRLAKTAAYDGARIELTLVDAVPNRPTFKQLGDVPGLSYQSFGLGGADIEGQVVTPDGRTTPVAYHYYENDIRYVHHVGTWSDAEWTFDRFAAKLARGDAYASR